MSHSNVVGEELFLECERARKEHRISSVGQFYKSMRNDSANLPITNECYRVTKRIHEPGSTSDLENGIIQWYVIPCIVSCRVSHFITNNVAAIRNPLQCDVMTKSE